MNSTKRKDSAVSPVIGVMLMIVVTIIIAAIVSAFAGDLSGGNDKKTAPMASIQCQIQVTGYTSGYPSNAVLTMEHLSGDAINTQYLRIIVSHTNAFGTPLQQRTIVPGYLVSGFTNSTSTSTSAYVPYLTDAKVGEVGSPQVNFGNYVWTPGQIITTGSIPGGAGFVGITGINFPTSSSSSEANFKPGDIINVKLIDTNTQKTIMDQDVTVQ